MKDLMAHVIAFFLGAAVMAAVFMSTESTPQPDKKSKQQQKGPSQPIAPAGVANQNKGPNNNGPQTGPPPHQASK